MRAGMQACSTALSASQGKIDILVHNVGQNLARPAETVELEEWQHFLDLNLTSAYISVHAVLPAMLSAGTDAFCSSALRRLFGGGGAIDYAAAKAGLHGMMTYLSRTYARRGIVTNLIHPWSSRPNCCTSAMPMTPRKRSSPHRSPSDDRAARKTSPAWLPTWPAHGATISADRLSW